MTLISGVYAIINQINERAYIGGSSDVKRRWGTHRSHLKRGYHGNRPMQADYNLLGSEVFELQIIEYLPVELVEQGEQIALDYAFETVGQQGLYNIDRHTTRATYTGFISPEGVPHPPITNLLQFCRDYDLSPASMYSLMNGKVRSCKGWIHKK